MFGGDRSGLTLVETLIAVSILGIGIAAALEMSARTLRTQAAAERHLEGVALAEAKMNELATLPPDALLGYAETQSGELELNRRSYRWQARVQRDIASPALWNAAVRIEWRGGDYDLKTTLFRPGRIRSLGGRP